MCKPNSPTCLSKRAYDKRGAISEANRWWRLNRKVLSVYPCGTHWHLTSKQAKRKPKLKHGKIGEVGDRDNLTFRGSSQVMSRRRKAK